MEAGRASIDDEAGAGLAAMACACDHKALGVMEMEPARECPLA